MNGSLQAMINVCVPIPYAFAQCEGVKSFVDDLSLGQGVVLSRAASTLRSIETQPFDRGFVRIRRAISFRLLILQSLFFFNSLFSFDLVFFSIFLIKFLFTIFASIIFRDLKANNFQFIKFRTQHQCIFKFAQSFQIQFNKTATLFRLSLSIGDLFALDGLFPSDCLFFFLFNIFLNSLLHLDFEFFFHFFHQSFNNHHNLDVKCFVILRSTHQVLSSFRLFKKL